MSDYVKTTNFTAKDALTTGDPAKLIKGSLFDTEYDDIATAVATKYDVGDMAVNATAAALVSTVTIINPANLKYAIENGTFTDGGAVFEARTLTAGAGLTGGGTLAADRTFNVGAGTGIAVNADDVALSFLGLEALVDPNADRIAFWDDSLGAFKWLTPSTGLTISGANMTVNAAGVDHDSLSGFVADEHIAHSGVTLTAGTGLSGGGTIAASRSFALDISGLTALSGSSIIGTDGMLVDDGGTMKRVAYQSAGVPKVADVGTTPTPTDAQMNMYWTCTNAAAITFTLNTGIGEAGNVIIIEQGGAGQVTLGGTATINSAFTSDATRTTNSVIVLYCTAANTWTLYGDAV